MIWKAVRIAVIVVLLVSATSLFVLRVNITRDIDAISGQALTAYPGSPDRVSALMSFLTDEEQPLADRDRAVWALGQYRNSRALPLLWSNMKEEECRHGAELCQRGLAKAVALCENPGPDLLRIAAR